MPFNWNAEKERAMLLIACADLKPGTGTWHTVANRLGGGLSANAVRCARYIVYFFFFHTALVTALHITQSLTFFLQPEILQAQEGVRETHQQRWRYCTEHASSETG